MILVLLRHCGSHQHFCRLPMVYQPGDYHPHHLTYITNYSRVVLSNFAIMGFNKRTVRSISQWMASLVQSNRDMLLVSLVVAGWDEIGPQVYDITLSGALVQRKLVLTGSGSSYIAAWIDRNYREDFTVEQATEFAVRAICHAIVRDTGCGGVVNLVVIRKDETTRKTLRPESPCC
jgi:20S proteasome alpha/beta subunit